MPARITQEEYELRSNKAHNYKFDYTKTKYVNASGKVIITCPVHGDFSCNAYSHMSGIGCAKCSGKVRKTTGQFIAEAKQNLKHSGVDYSEVKYINNSTKVVLTCSQGHRFFLAPKDHLQGVGCGACFGNALSTTVKFKVAARIVHGDLYSYDNSEYRGKAVKLLITCREHGDFLQCPNNHLMGSGCPKCCGLHKTDEEIIKSFCGIHGDRYGYELVKYVKSDVHVDIICKEHGTFPQTPSAHLVGQGCPKCVSSISSYELTLASEFACFEQTNKKVIGPKHLDLYSKEHDLAIEIDGRYWHSEEFGKTKNYHLAKTEECLKKGVTLLHFWDDEVRDQLEIVKSIIRSKIGTTSRVFARKTEAREIDVSTARNFLCTNHLQASAGASKCYGLFQGEELVMVTTFRRPRFTQKFEWEIIRSASRLNTTVVGGSSKLLALFIREQNPLSILTYADRRYSEGKGYSKLGFEFSHNSPPSYFYLKSRVIILRYQAQKHKLPKLLGDKFDPELSEVQNMLASGYYRVWDCGTAVFTWKAPT